MKLWPIFCLLGSGLVVALPPPGAPLPRFVDVDTTDWNAIFKSRLEGVWSTQSDAQSLRFQLMRSGSNGLQLRLLTQSSCKWLPINAWTVERQGESDDSIVKVQVTVDGDRRPDNCVSLPAWITFDFGSPSGKIAAKVTVRQQFPEGPDESEYWMSRKPP